MTKRTPPELARFPAAKQRRMDRLLEKNREGTLKAGERAQLTRLVAEAERLMVDNARRLEEFSRGEQRQPPRSSVPVTVWVTPQSAER